MTATVTIGIDLAKNVFAVHGVDIAGKSALVRPSVPRGKLLALLASLPPCVIFDCDGVLVDSLSAPPTYIA